MAKKKKKGTNSEEKVKFLTRIGNLNAKKLRNNQTKYELILGKYLKELGYNFKAQVPIITAKHKLYIVDFLLPDYSIFIEADSVKWHGNKEQIKADNRRTKALRKEGYEPIRLFNKQIETLSIDQIQQIIELKIALLKENC